MSRLSKPIETVNTYSMDSFWHDKGLETDNTDSIYDYNLVLMRQLEGLEIDLKPLNNLGCAATASVKVDKASTHEQNIINNIRPFSLGMPVGQVLRLKTIWYEPHIVADYNRDIRRIRSERQVVGRTCAGMADEVGLKLLVLMNLFLPGSSRSLTCFSNFDVIKELPHIRPGSLGCVSNFDDVSVLFLKAGLDPTPTFHFKNLLDWSLSIRGFWKDLPETNVGRALNFLSHAHHRTHHLNTFADICWIIAALEALLTDSSQDIRAKIVRRALSISPDIQELAGKKALGKLYDFRSRFLHGDIPLPNHFTTIWGNDWYGFEFADAFDLASAILIRCLQRIAENKWTRLSFTEIPEGSSV